MESDTYLIESNDERKQPAKPSIKARRQINIKREEEEVNTELPASIVVNQREEEDVNIELPASFVMTQTVEEEVDIDLPASTVMNDQITPTPQPMLSQREEILNEIAKPDWMRGEETSMIRPTWIRKECYSEYETDQEYESTAIDDEDKTQSKRKKSHDNPSSFDIVITRKDDDEEDPPSSSKTGGVRRRSSSQAQAYHYQTRQATRRTRSDCKRHKTCTSNRKDSACSSFVRTARDPLDGIFRSHATVKSAMVRGPIKRRGIPPERLMKAWKIDRDTAV